MVYEPTYSLEETIKVFERETNDNVADSGKKIVIFYTEILTGKVVLWCFFTSETSEKIHNSTFLVNISV